MGKKDKKKDEKAAPPPKDEKKGGGLLGRLFGGGGKPATPKGDDAMDAPTIPPDNDEMNPDMAKTIPPVDRDEVFEGDAADQMTLAPTPELRNMMKGVKGGAAPASPVDPFDDPAEARTIPPFDPPKSVKGAKLPKPETVELDDPFDDGADARTIPPFDRPKNLTPPPKTPGGKKPNVPPPSDIFSSDAMTLPPTKAADLDLDGLDDIPLDAPTLAPHHLKGQVPPRAPSKPATGRRAREDDMLTQDPLLTPTPKEVAKDPFAFEDDILGDGGLGDSGGLGDAPRGKAPAPPSSSLDDDLGFGPDVPDLLAPMAPAPPPPAPRTTGRQAPVAANDPFGAALADDPFEPVKGRGGAAPNKTDEIPSFDVELSGAPATPAVADASEDDGKTMEMDRPATPAAPTTPRRISTRLAPPPAPKRTLFASSVANADGSRRFGPPAPEVQVDHEKGTLFAPRTDGGWHEVPSFAAVLSDGTVVGRLPRGVTYEADGSVVIPAAAAGRAPTKDEAGATKVPAFPEGVIVDRLAGFAYAPADKAALLEGSPEALLRLEDGAVIVTLPQAARWEDDGSYSVAADALAAGRKDPDTIAEKAKETHASHGYAVWKASYLGCEEVVYEDGWAALKLPKSAKVEGELVLLPASSRVEPGAPPELLELEARPDGSVALRLPPGYVPEGDVAWLPPAEIAAEDSRDPVDTDWGDPTEELDYCGIHEALFANGWTRLDLPPGARVVGRKLVLPREYAHAGDARALSEFDRDTDGSLVFELPRDAEALGSAVLMPPEGVRSFAGGFSPSSPSSPSSSSSSSRSTSSSSASSSSSSSSSSDAPLRRATASMPAVSDSALPPSGAGVGPKTKGIDRFRVKKALEDDKPAETGTADEKKAEEKKADEPKADEPKAEDKKADEPKADDEKKSDEPKADEPKAEDKKADEPKADEPKADDEKKSEEPKSEDKKAEDDKDEGADDAPEAPSTSGRKKRKKS